MKTAPDFSSEGVGLAPCAHAQFRFTPLSSSAGRRFVMRKTVLQLATLLALITPFLGGSAQATDYVPVRPPVVLGGKMGTRVTDAEYPTCEIPF